MPQNNYTSALGLDIGSSRIGVARMSSIARLPEPLTTLQNDIQFITKLLAIISEQQTDLIVVGLPRNMSGEETAQSAEVRDFIEKTVRPFTNLTIIYQDETLSSVGAADYPENLVAKFGIDAIAAAEILRYYTQAKL